VWTSRLAGIPFPERVAGVDFDGQAIGGCVRAPAERLLPGRQARGRGRAGPTLRARLPWLKVAGSRDGYFGPAEHQGIVDHIRRAAPHMLFVGMPSPFQGDMVRTAPSGPQLAPDHGALEAPSTFLPGMCDAPRSRCMSMGLEWLWRLAMEPRKNVETLSGHQHRVLVVGGGEIPEAPGWARARGRLEKRSPNPNELSKNRRPCSWERAGGHQMAPVVAALQKSGDLQCRVVATGQHREDVPAGRGSVRLRRRRRPRSDAAPSDPGWADGAPDGEHRRLGWKRHPDMALVQGDTTTVLVAALACFYRKIPNRHVEAGCEPETSGLPSRGGQSPLASPIVSLHFAPTQSAKAALLNEGVSEASIEVTGNTVVDALLMELAQQEKPAIRADVRTSLSALLGSDWAEVPFVLITGHRRENFGEGIRQICEAITTLARAIRIITSCTPCTSTRTSRGTWTGMLGGLSNVRLVEPQGYRNFVALMARCRLVLTDSGGVQEEAPSLGKPVLVMRDTTERPEGVEAGTALLIGPRAQSIVEQTSRLLDDRERIGPWRTR